jgi:hypothetical protein
LLPDLAEGPVEPLPAWTLTPEQERRLMVRALVQFLTNVAGPAGTLLVLDPLYRPSDDWSVRPAGRAARPVVKPKPTQPCGPPTPH